MTLNIRLNIFSPPSSFAEDHERLNIFKRIMLDQPWVVLS